MAIEQEMKLELGATPVSAVVAFFEDLTGVAGRTQTLKNLYFDTPELALAKGRVALRLRSTAAGWLQTLKTAGKASQGMHARGEWEQAVAGEALELPALLDACDDDAACAAVTPLIGRLQPVFRTDFERTVWDLSIDGTRIEVALDLGTVTAGNAAPPLPIREIELELKEGSETALRAFAEKLCLALPALAPNDVSKAARGYRLVRAGQDAALSAKKG